MPFDAACKHAQRVELDQIVTRREGMAKNTGNEKDRDSDNEKLNPGLGCDPRK